MLFLLKIPPSSNLKLSLFFIHFDLAFSYEIHEPSGTNMAFYDDRWVDDLNLLYKTGTNIFDFFKFLNESIYLKLLKAKVHNNILSYPIFQSQKIMVTLKSAKLDKIMLKTVSSSAPMKDFLGEHATFILC